MANQIALIPPELDAFSPVRAVVYSPSGNWLAWGADDSPVTWRDTRTGNTFQDASAVRPRLVYALAFSPDERWLVSGSQDGTIVIRDLLTGESRQIGRLPAPVHSLYIDRENRLVAAVGDAVWPWLLDALWKSTEPPAGEPLIQQERDILSIAWDPVKRRLATGSQDGAVRIYEPGKDGVVLLEKVHTRAVRALAWSPDGSRLASAGDDGSVVIWDPLTGMPDGEPLTEKVLRPLYGVSFSPDGRLLAAGGANNELVLWDVASRQEVAAVRDRFGDDITGLAFSPHKQAGKDLLLAGSASGQVVMFTVVPEQILVDQQLPKVESGFLMALSNTAGGEVEGLALTPTGSEVVAADPGDETWQVLSPSFERVTAAAFSLDAKILALAQPVDDGQAVVSMVNTGDWEETGRLEFALAGEQTSSLFGLAFDARGTTLAASQCVQQSPTNAECTPNQNHLQFQSISPRATLLQDVNVGENRPRLLAYDPLGRYLASVGQAAGVELWPLSENGQALQGTDPIIKEILSDQRATALAFSFDGSLLAVGLEHGSVELWDTRSWQRLGYPLAAAEAQISRAGLRPGRRLADRRLRGWRREALVGRFAGLGEGSLRACGPFHVRG